MAASRGPGHPLCRPSGLQMLKTGSLWRRCDWHAFAPPATRGHPLTQPRAQGLTTPKSDPFVRLRLRDSPSTRAVWDHAFELEYTVTLGIKQLGLRLTAQNTGTKDLEFCTALRAHLGVSDLANDPIMVLVRTLLPPTLTSAQLSPPPARRPLQGLQNVRYDDKSETRQGGSDLPRWPSPSMKFTCVHSVTWGLAHASTVGCDECPPPCMQGPKRHCVPGVPEACGAGGGHRLHGVCGEHGWF